MDDSCYAVDNGLVLREEELRNRIYIYIRPKKKKKQRRIKNWTSRSGIGARLFFLHNLLVFLGAHRFDGACEMGGGT